MWRVHSLHFLCGVLPLVIAGSPAMAAAAQTFTFDVMPIEQPAEGLTGGITSTPGAVSSRSRASASQVWCAVLADSGAPSGEHVVTIVSTSRQNQAFPLCLADRVSVRDVDLSTRFKPVSGTLDRAAGLVLRARDMDNYYVVSANALENNVRLYRVVRSRRTLLAGRDVTVATGVWQTLRVRAEGARFAVYFDGELLFEATDRMFGDIGGVGLWVKSDSVTSFDDFAILSLDP